MAEGEYEYTCIEDCEFPVEPCGVRLNPDGSGETISLHHYFRIGEKLRNPQMFDPLPTANSVAKGPHAVVNRCFACSDRAIEAQRKELWKREDAEKDIRDREAILQQSKDTPTMKLAQQQAEMQANALKGAFKELAQELRQPTYAPAPAMSSQEPAEAPSGESEQPARRKPGRPPRVAEPETANAE